MESYLQWSTILESISYYSHLTILAGKCEHHTKLQSYKNELNHEIGPFGLYFNQNHSHLHPRNCSTLQRSNEMKKTLGEKFKSGISNYYS